MNKSNKSNKSSNSEDNDNNKIKEIAQQKGLEVQFLEEVVKYVKIDDIIRQETTEYKNKLKHLKEQKESLEKNLIVYLELQKQNCVNFKGGNLITSERKSVGAVKPIYIKESVFEEIEKTQLITDEQEKKQFIDDVIELIQNKRPVKIKKTLKRKFEKQPKVKK